MKRIIILSLIIFTLGVSLSLFLSSRSPSTDGFAYGGDDVSYGYFGKMLAHLWGEGIFIPPEKLPGDSNLYSYYCALIYYMLDKHGTLVLLILSSVFHILILYPIYQICKELDIKPEKVLYLALLWPSLIYWSLFNLKESFVLFFLFMAVCFAMKVKREKNFINTLGLLISLLIIDQTRFAFSAMSIIVLVYLTFEWRWNKFIILLLVAICFFIRIESQIGLWHLPKTLMGTITLEHTAEVESTYFTAKKITGWQDMTTSSPNLIFTTIIHPFRFDKVKYVFATIENMIWICLLPFVIRNLLKKKVLLLNMIFIYWFFLLAYTQWNMGTLYRLKALLYYLTIILAWRIEKVKWRDS